MRVLLIVVSFCVFSCAGIRSRYHEVTKGESLWAIAHKYEIPVQELKSENASVLQGNVLQPGMKLFIPFEESPEWAQPQRVRSVASVRRANDSSSEPVAYNLKTSHFSQPIYGSWISSYYGKRKRRGRRRVERHLLVVLAFE